MGKILRIGTRESELAIWQATSVQKLLKTSGISSELVFIKSEGDIDTVTPLYALGVTGVFTKTLDTALLNNRIDIAVHSMKDVPVQLARGLKQAAVLKRGSYKDILVPHPDLPNPQSIFSSGTITITDITIREVGSKVSIDAIVATSSIRRSAQWVKRYPQHQIVDLRGNVNTRLRKLKESNWHGAIFAAAGLERINLRPKNAIELDWMLPAPAQGAIMIVCRDSDQYVFESCQNLNHEETELCTKIERDFLSGLMGGCSTPISALAEVKDSEVHFKGNIVSPISYHMSETIVTRPLSDARDLGLFAAKRIMSEGGEAILENIRKKGLATNGEV